MSLIGHFKTEADEKPDVGRRAGVAERNRAVPGLRRELEVWASLLTEETGEGKRLGEREATDRWARAVSCWLIDASLLGDTESLHAGLEVLRSAHVRLRPVGPTARLEAMVAALAETARAGLDRARQTELAQTLDPDSWAARMLTTIDGQPGIISSMIAKELDADESQVSRSGRALVERGLAVKTRNGRSKGWRVTPRGAVTAEQLRSRIR